MVNEERRINKIPWEDFVYYDPNTVSCLRWKIQIGKNIKAGTIVGSINKGRCSFVFSHNGIKKRRYTHRVIWELFNGEIPENMEIDHIDGNPLNNKINNLRIVSRKTNSRNSRMNSRNTSGIAGVSLTTINGYDYYTVTYVDNFGKRKIKHFSCLKLGSNAKILAITYREEQLKLLGEYTMRHGK